MSAEYDRKYTYITSLKEGGVMKRRAEQGFTLVEVMVVAAIIAVLAGILVPMIFNQIDEARISRANADCKTIMSSMMVFYKHTGKWPCTDPDNNAGPVTLMHSKGNIPADGPDVAGLGPVWDRTVPVHMTFFLRDNPNVGGVTDYNNWKGPYMTAFDADPWGNAYIINTDGLVPDSGKMVYVLSAGPNGVIETPANANSLVGDDIGHRIL
jgi:prepilin-type N-terminal cleavage/methylation domain-containing protein